MTFLSVYNSRIKSVADWCDAFYLKSLQHTDSTQPEGPENSSLVGQLEAEVLGRFVCLGTIATGVVLIPVDIVLTALIGVGVFACAVAQNRGFYKTFISWRKDTETEVMFLGMIIISIASLARSIFFDNRKDPYVEKNKTPSLEDLYVSAYSNRCSHRDDPIYSRTSAIIQLFSPVSFFRSAFCLVLGCISVPFNLATLGYFRKWNDSYLTQMSSFPIYTVVAYAFKTLSCFIHIAKPESKRYAKLCALKNIETNKNFTLEPNALLETEASIWILVSFSEDYKCWKWQNCKKGITAIALVSRDEQGDFAVNEDRIVLVKQVKEAGQKGKMTTKWFLEDNKEISLRIDANGCLVSNEENYAVLGSDSDGCFFTLNGGLTPLNVEKSTMRGAPLMTPET